MAPKAGGIPAHALRNITHFDGQPQSHILPFAPLVLTPLISQLDSLIPMLPIRAKRLIVLSDAESDSPDFVSSIAYIHIFRDNSNVQNVVNGASNHSGKYRAGKRFKADDNRDALEVEVSRTRDNGDGINKKRQGSTTGPEYDTTMVDLQFGEEDDTVYDTSTGVRIFLVFPFNISNNLQTSCVQTETADVS
jgi:hypothetical protein